MHAFKSKFCADDVLQVHILHSPRFKSLVAVSKTSLVRLFLICCRYRKIPFSREQNVLKYTYIVSVGVNFTQLIFNCFNNGNTLIYWVLQLISQRMFYKSYIVSVGVNFTQLIFTCFNNGYTLYCMQLISQRRFYKSYIVNVCVNFTQLIFICFNNGYTLIY